MFTQIKFLVEKRTIYFLFYCIYKGLSNFCVYKIV